MTQNQTPSSLIGNVAKHLPLVEKILLMGLIIGAVLRIMHIDAPVTEVSLLLLSFTFFLLAYRPIEIPRQEDEKFGFSELLALTIVPKVLWIASAVSALGLSFYFFDLENEGYKRMLLIGGTAIAGGTALLLFSRVKGVKYLETTAPVLGRAIPLLLIDFYILLQ